ncbi:MAG: arsenic efflux protein [Bacteroidales bacterium]|nr:arsenic efflux protein [Bacteroidales bacterium]
MNWHLVIDVLKNSVLITGLVLIMMLMIEYFNIHSHGKWFSRIKDSKIKQIFLGSLLGLVPGCIGGFATVSLYTHRLLSLGALVAMMIASSGDEAFVIMAMIPKEGFILFGLLFAISIITGIIVDYVIYKNPQKDLCPDDFEIHTAIEEESRKIPSIFKLESYKVMLKPSKERVAILTGIAVFIAAVIMGILACGHDHSHSGDGAHHSHQAAETYVCEHRHVHTTADAHNAAHVHNAAEAHQEHHHSHDAHVHKVHESASINILNEKSINIAFAIISIITLFFTATANEHFIKDHIWKHVIKRHLLSIFLWTFGTLLVCQFGMQYLDIEHWISNNKLLVVLLAVAIGIIPESGPHMVFVTLFAQGILPFYVLLVNSIVQDGHSALPLLAESKMSFAKAKLINIAAGLLIGIACLILL